MSDLMLEVNDALRAKQLEAFWNKYGTVIIGIVVATIMATVIGVIWNAHMNSVLAKDTDSFVQAMEGSDDQTIIASLSTLSETAHQPVKGLVDLTLAQKYEEAEQTTEALALYKAVSEQSRVPQATQAVAQLNYVRLGLTQNDADLDALLKTIEPLAAQEGAFRPSALEMKALVLIRQNKIDEANTLLAEMSEDVTISSTLRQRSKALIVHEAMHDTK